MSSFYSDPVDTIICQLTNEARNLLARIKFGSSLIFKQVGWQLGRGGYNPANPVKVLPIVDNATQSVGYIEVVSNTFDAGDKILVNGVPFTYNVNWRVGTSLAQTASNILAAVNDSRDPRVYNLISVQIDPVNPNRLMFTSLVVGNVLTGKSWTFAPSDVDVAGNTIAIPRHGFPEFMQVELSSTISLPQGLSAGTSYYIVNVTDDTFQLSSTLNTPTLVSITGAGTGSMTLTPTGNVFPLNNNETTGLGSTTNFSVTPMSMPTSMTLADPAYPVPPDFGVFVLPDGRIESPTPSSVSFVMCVPDGTVGMNGYGEIGVWVEILESNHPLEIGRQVLFAYAHFPIQCKTDRSVLTYRVIINFG